MKNCLLNINSYIQCPANLNHKSILRGTSKSFARYDVEITPGQKKQRLFNVRRHFMESSSAGRENVPSESVVNLDMDEGKKISFLKKISPGTFEVKGGYVVCSFCVGSNRTINLNPNHGSFKNNVHSHLQSKQHSAASKGKRQGTPDAMFFTKSSSSRALSSRH